MWYNACVLRTHVIFTLSYIAHALTKTYSWGYMRLCCHLVGSRSLIDSYLCLTASVCRWNSHRLEYRCSLQMRIGLVTWRARRVSGWLPLVTRSARRVSGLARSAGSAPSRDVRLAALLTRPRCVPAARCSPWSGDPGLIWFADWRILNASSWLMIAAKRNGKESQIETQIRQA